jgi:multiple sugar transport system substrate-binding protein
MEEITFSVFNHGQDSIDALRSLLGRFEREEGVRVRVEVVPWAMGWSRTVEIALYHSGPDICEVGNTWIGDLVRMGSVRLFHKKEIDAFIEEEPFFTSVWTTGIQDDQGQPLVYSIPWSGDARVIFYRKDMLKAAGVDEKNAFRSMSEFERSLAAIQSAGNPMPLSLPSRRSNLTLHNLASWVWSCGGDFLSRDGLQIEFDQPRALDGIRAYFRLGHYLNDEARFLDELNSDQMFWSGRAAVLISGYWILNLSARIDAVRENLGVAPVPGVPFVGGNQLVIWNHSRHVEAAIKLIKFLHKDAAAKAIYPNFGLPIRESLWSRPPFDTKGYDTFKAAILTGRGFPGGQLWGLVEKRLVDVLAEIWVEVLKEPKRLDTIVESQLNSLARRLQLSLEQ